MMNRFEIGLRLNKVKKHLDFLFLPEEVESHSIMITGNVFIQDYHNGLFLM